REVHLWSNLRHKNIQLLSGISTDFNMTVSLIHPWMEKGNAFDYVQNKSVDPRPLLLGIANGLHYLHSHESGPILHGSLRGSNVLICDDGEARLIDFGFTSLVNSTFGLPISTARVGALNWTAPECLEECEPALEQDVWSYGMTALELFTREPPFHDKPTIRVLMQRIMEGPPDRPSARSTHSRLTDGWWEICMLCWRRDPSARPGIADIVAKIATESEKRV
ncbi:kinase-like domain-containing protein, partial [Pisolithus croceorrhizus]